MRYFACRFNYYVILALASVFVVSVGKVNCQPFIVSVSGLGQYGYFEKDAIVNAPANFDLTNGGYTNIYNYGVRSWINGNTNDYVYMAATPGGCSRDAEPTTNFFPALNTGSVVNSSVFTEYCGPTYSHGSMTPIIPCFNERSFFVIDVSGKTDALVSAANYNSANFNVVLTFTISNNNTPAQTLNRLWIENEGSAQEGTDIKNEAFELYYESATGFETFNGNESHAMIYGDYNGNPTSNNIYGNDALGIPIPQNSTGGLRCYVVLKGTSAYLNASAKTKTVRMSILADGISILPDRDSNHSLLKLDKTTPSATTITIADPTFTTAQAGDWNNGTTWAGGIVPTQDASVTIAHAITINAPVSNAPYSILVNASSGITFGASGSITVNQSITNNGILDMTSGGTLSISDGGTLVNGTSVFTGGAGTVHFTGAGAVTGTITFNNVTIAGAVNFGPSSVLNGTLRINDGGFVNINAPAYGSGSLLHYYMGGTYNRDVEWSQTSSNAYPYNVTISNNTTLYTNSVGANILRQIAGTLTIDPGSTLDMGNMTGGGILVLGNIINNGTLLMSGSSVHLKCTSFSNGPANPSAVTTLSSVSGGDLEVSGDFSDFATFNPNSRAVYFTGATGNQTITKSGGETFDYLLVQKAAGNVVLASNITVNQLLTLTSGLITTGSNRIIISSSLPGAISSSGSTSYINGNLRRSIASGPNTYLFPVGTSGAYAPVSFDFQAGTASGFLDGATANGDHASVASSTINGSKSVNRTWTFVLSSGLATVSYDATFNWVSGDQDVGFVSATSRVGRYASGWNLPLVSSRPSSTSIKVTGLSAFGEFQVANDCVNPAINPMSTTVCSGSVFTITPVDGTNGTVPAETTYSWPAPSVTGGITGGAAGSGASVISGTLTNPAATTQTATYTVTPLAGTCAGANFTATVSIIPLNFGGTATATTSTVLPGSVCTGSTAKVTLAGYTGTIQWQQSADGSSGWGNVVGGSGATAAVYTTPNLLSSTWYRAAVTSGSCTAYSSVAQILVTTTTSIPGTATVASSPICSGQSTSITLSGYSGTILWVYSLDGSLQVGGASGLNTNAIYNTPNLATTYWYRARLTNGACQTYTPWEPVEILAPISAITALPATPPCPNVAGLTYSVTPVPYTTYDWTVPVGWTITSGEGTHKITVTSGFYGQNGNIEVTATNICQTSTKSMAVTVLEAPAASITANYCSTPGSITLTAHPEPSGHSYLWTTSGPPTNGSTSQSITVTLAGIYTVTVKNNSTQCTSSVTPTVSNELVVNGDFELGYFGFASDYSYVPDIDGNSELATGGILGPGGGLFGIGIDPQNYHPDFYGRDHTTNTGNFMILNGVPDLVVWKQENITVKPNTEYYFSAWAISLTGHPETAQLSFRVNGNLVGSTVTLVPRPGTNNAPFNYQRFYGTWPSDTNTRAKIEIVDLSTDLAGNDFGLDDISFGTLQPTFVTPGAAANGGAPVCEGGSVDLSVSISGGLAPFDFTWIDPDGDTLSKVQNPTIPNATTANNGIYTVYIRDFYGCAPASSTASVAVLPMPTAIVSGTTSVCKDAAPASVSFAGAGSTAPYTFTYSINGGADITTSATSVIVPAAATDYTYTLTRVASANGCSQPWTSAATVTVKDVTATITGTTAVCLGAAPPDISFTGAGWRSAPPYTFTYKINGVLQPTETTSSDRCLSISAPTNVAGPFIYELVSVSDALGCSFPVSGSAMVTVYPAPVISGTNSACVNQTGNIYTTDGGMTGYTWSITGGTITSATNTNPVTVNWGAQGVQTIRVNYTNTHGCAAASPTIFTVYVGNMWTGATNNDWNNAGNWCENTVPDASKDVVIATVPGNPQPQIFSTTAISGNLALADPTASLTINAGQALTVNGNLTNNGGTFTVNSNALNNNGSLIVKGTTSAGNVIYKRFLTPSENRWFIASSPVNTSSGGFDGTNVKYDNTYSSFDFAPYIEANNFGWDYQAALPLSLTNGKGYLTRVIGTGILNFTGPLNNTDVTIAVTGSSSYGWNAVGNPFTSAIGITENALSTEKFLSKNSSVLDPNYRAIYLWYQSDGTPLGTGSYNPGDQYYRTINNIGYTGKAYGGPVPENNIQAGQGFLINVSNNGSIVFTKNNSAGTAGMQVHSPVITMKSTQSSWPGLTLLASNSGRTRSTVVAFNGNMTNGLDPSYDAGLLSVSDFNLYTHLVDGSTETNFTIQCLPGINYSTYSVPVGIDMPVPGKVTFKVSGLILPEGIYPVIEDRLLQTSTPLKTENDSLTVNLAEPSWGTGRFYLRFGETLVVTADNNLPTARQFTANYSDGIITLFGSPETGSKAWLYDVNGRKLGGEFHLTSENQNEIPAANLASGIYLLRIEGKASRQTIKITVLNR